MTTLTSSPSAPPTSPPPPPPASAPRDVWPWAAAESTTAPAHLPRITVVTPSYNQAAYLEMTIRSVLLQDYPNLEYIVIDGGSTDDSPAIIRKYASHLAHWESTADRGQGHAINKGLELATGEIVCWLNSDDYFTPGALRTVGDFFSQHPETHAVVGDARSVNPDGSSHVLTGEYHNYRRLVAYWKSYHMPQPAIFWRKHIQDAVGPLNEKEHLIMDYDLWLRIGRRTGFVPLDRVLACAHAHEQAKTGHDFSQYHMAQLGRVFRQYGLPITPSRVPIACSLYWHLAKTAVRALLGKPLIYQRKYWMNGR